MFCIVFFESIYTLYFKVSGCFYAVLLVDLFCHNCNKYVSLRVLVWNVKWVKNKYYISLFEQDLPYSLQ